MLGLIQWTRFWFNLIHKLHFVARHSYYNNEFDMRKTKTKVWTQARKWPIIVGKYQFHMHQKYRIDAYAFKRNWMEKNEFTEFTNYSYPRIVVMISRTYCCRTIYCSHLNISNSTDNAIWTPFAQESRDSFFCVEPHISVSYDRHINSQHIKYSFKLLNNWLLYIIFIIWIWNELVRLCTLNRNEKKNRFTIIGA